MKILFATVTGRGHINPLLPLAAAFARAGHSVTFATADDMSDVIREAGHEFVPAGLTAAEQHDALADQPRPDPTRAVDFAFGVLFPRLHAPRMLPDLLHAVDDVRPELLVCDSAELTTPLVGSLRDIPWVHHGYGILRPPSAWQLASEAMTPLWAAHGLATPPRAGMFDGAYVDVCPTSLQIAEIDSVPTRFAQRPAGAPSSVGTPTGRRVLLTFGTVFHGNIAPLAELLGTLPIELTVTRDYVPLADVLPECVAVVTHGGSGTMLAALAHGVPLVVVPQGADNLYNGARIAERHAGRCVAQFADVPDALTGIMADTSYAESARQIADEIQRMPTADDVAAHLTEWQPGQALR